jgi:hypothetical protein
MPRRLLATRVNQIAKDAFRFLIPRQWTFQRIEPDYGIGAGVEIFDGLGKTTGLRCRVQLTGSDARSLSDALTLHLPKERLEYYGELEPPVLMVRYHARTGRFFARWALKLDPREQERATVEPGAENQIAFRWSLSDRWSDESAVRLENDLRLLRQLRDPGFSWPMRFTLHVEAGALSDGVKERIGAAIRKQWSEMSRYVAIVEETAEAHGSITLSPKMVRAAIGSFHVVAIHLTEPHFAVEKLPATLAHVLVLVAIALTRAGHVEVAARLCQLSFGRRG